MGVGGAVAVLTIHKSFVVAVAPAPSFPTSETVVFTAASPTSTTTEAGLLVIATLFILISAGVVSPSEPPMFRPVVLTLATCVDLAGSITNAAVFAIAVTAITPLLPAAVAVSAVAPPEPVIVFSPMAMVSAPTAR
jgi:hypothetical protein